MPFLYHDSYLKFLSPRGYPEVKAMSLIQATKIARAHVRNQIQRTFVNMNDECRHINER